MGFDRNNNGGGRGDYSGGNRSYGGGGGGFNRGDREMFQATCADCGKQCEIPFKPSGSRPVYCSDCFKNHSSESNDRGGDRGGDRGDRGGNRDYNRDSRRGLNDRQMFNAVCDKCGDKCQLPFMPREGKEVLCSKCFEEKGGDPRKGGGNSQQIAELNAKLDQILELLGAKPVKKAKVEKAPKEEAVVEEIAQDGEVSVEAPVEVSPEVETLLTSGIDTPTPESKSSVEVTEEEVAPKKRKVAKSDE